jgi:mono/diheme cytochrome c family protein
MNLLHHRSSAAAGRALGAAGLLAAATAGAQTPGNAANGEILFNNNDCAGCHTLAAQRAQITNRAPNAGTLSYDKSLAALNAALSGTDLDGVATGMNVAFGALTTQQRADIAAYIAGLAAPAPVLTYSPTGGPVFPATAIGAMSSATVTITNTGTANLVFVMKNAVTIATGGDAADFRVTSSTCPGVTLQPNTGNCTINATFQPLAGMALTRTASLGLTTTTGTSLVPMTGIVTSSSTSPPPPPSGAANPPSSGGGGSLPLLGLALLAALSGVRRRAFVHSVGADQVPLMGVEARVTRAGAPSSCERRTGHKTSGQTQTPAGHSTKVH